MPLKEKAVDYDEKFILRKDSTEVTLMYNIVIFKFCVRIKSITY